MKNFMKRKFIFVLLAGSFLFSSCIFSQEINEIPLKLSAGKTLVTVKIGDLEIPDILLDTGLPFDGVIIYNPDYEDLLDMTGAVRVRIGGAGKDEDSYALMIDSSEFMLGNIKMKNQKILLLQGDVYKGFPTNGIIGNSIFGHYTTGLDYDRNIMTLYENRKYETDENWIVIPLYFKGNNIPWLDVSVVVDDESPVSLSVYIDYASRYAVELLEKNEMKFSLPQETTQEYLGRGLSGDIYGKKGIISKLIIGKHEFKNVTAVFPSAEVRSKQQNADAILGSNALRRFNLIFDYAGKKLFLKPNSFFNEPFE